ncbi:hypothetical protein L605_001600000240 [Bacillus subtilis J26]|nr:hypothetical protein JN25_03980 [Bacillus sp. BSC154]TWG67467.1 hypothetical protein L607_001600000040 [Bacillus subtilis J24]TWG76125.1 hypothetical protein L605_001600000240 [Bacillus subtilis J26]
MGYNYIVTLLVYSEMEGGTNPSFCFDNFEETTHFMNTCFNNDYDVLVSRVDLEEGKSSVG